MVRHRTARLRNRRIFLGITAAVLLVVTATPTLAASAPGEESRLHIPSDVRVGILKGHPSAGAARIIDPATRGAQMSTINLQNVLRTLRGEAQAKYPGQFVQAAVDAERGTAIVYWHGKTPEEIQQHARSAGLADAISYVEVPYSLKELTSEARRISVEYPYVVSAGPSGNYQSIDVRVDDAKISMDAVKVQSSIPVNIIPSGGVVSAL